MISNTDSTLLICPTEHMLVKVYNGSGNRGYFNSPLPRGGVGRGHDRFNWRTYLCGLFLGRPIRLHPFRLRFSLGGRNDPLLSCGLGAFSVCRDWHHGRCGCAHWWAAPALDRIWSLESFYRPVDFVTFRDEKRDYVVCCHSIESYHHSIEPYHGDTTETQTERPRPSRGQWHGAVGAVVVLTIGAGTGE
jgi:hypothetical protein